MKTINRILPLLAILLVANVSFAQTDTKQDKLPTAEEVMNKYVKVTGGLEAYKGIKSMAAKANVSIPAVGIDGTMEMKMLLPGMISVVVDLPGVGETIQGANGKHAWASDAMTGTRLVDGKEAEQLQAETDITRYTDMKGFFKSMKNEGVEEVNGEKAYRIALVKKNGTKSTEFYSLESGFLIQSLLVVEAAGMGEIEITAKFGDYKDSGKFKRPFKMVQVLPSNMEQIIEFEKYEYNAELKASDFDPPADVQKLIAKKEKKAAKKKDDKTSN